MAGPWGARRRTARAIAAAVALATVVGAPACGSGSGGGRAGDGAGVGAPEGVSGQIALLTYNVAGQDVSSVGAAERIPQISPLLDGYDVVVTQEDYDWWTPMLDDLGVATYHELLRSETTQEYRSARHPGPQVAGVDPQGRRGLMVGDGLGILSRFPFESRYPLEDEARVAWSDCFGELDQDDGGAGDCLTMKGFATVTLSLDRDVTVDLYTLDAEGGTTARDQELQAADFAQLAEYITHHSDGHALIVAGDTNLHTDSDLPQAADGGDAEIWQGFLRATGLTDTCAALGCTQTDSPAKVAIRSDDGVTLSVASHDFPVERFRDADGNDLSEHAPLAVVIDWQAAR